jgi:hypothetical protein
MGVKYQAAWASYEARSRLGRLPAWIVTAFAVATNHLYVVYLASVSPDWAPDKGFQMFLPWGLAPSPAPPRPTQSRPTGSKEMRGAHTQSACSAHARTLSQNMQVPGSGLCRRGGRGTSLFATPARRLVAEGSSVGQGRAGATPPGLGALRRPAAQELRVQVLRATGPARQPGQPARAGQLREEHLPSLFSLGKWQGQGLAVAGCFGCGPVHLMRGSSWRRWPAAGRTFMRPCSKLMLQRSPLHPCCSRFRCYSLSIPYNACIFLIYMRVYYCYTGRLLQLPVQLRPAGATQRCSMACPDAAPAGSARP